MMIYKGKLYYNSEPLILYRRVILLVDYEWYKTGTVGWTPINQLIGTDLLCDFIPKDTEYPKLLKIQIPGKFLTYGTKKD